MNVGHENAASTEDIELVHDPVDIRSRNHGSDRGPLRVVQRGHSRRLDSGSQRACLLQVLRPDVVVDQNVRAGDHHAVKPPQESLYSWHLRGTGPSNDERLGHQDGLTHKFQARLAQRRTRGHDIGHGIRDTKGDGVLHRSIELHDAGIDPLPLEVILKYPCV